MLFPTTFIVDLKPGMNGKIIRPEMKKRMPANWNGALYFRPILTPTKAVAHSMHAMMAKKWVDLCAGCEFNFL